MSIPHAEMHRIDVLNSLLRADINRLYDCTLHDDFSAIRQLLVDGHPGYSHLSTEELERIADQKGLHYPKGEKTS